MQIFRVPQRLQKSMVVFTLTLVRHGETCANKDNVIQGQMDVPLSEIGFEQASLIGGRLQNQQYTHIFASDLVRAKQTAQMIIEKSQHENCKITSDPRLRERKFGEVEGKTFTDLKKLARRANQSVQNFTPSGAETVNQVRQRAIIFFQEMCQQILKLSSFSVNTFKELENESYCVSSGIKRRRHSSFCSDSCDVRLSDGRPHNQYDTVHNSEIERTESVSFPLETHMPCELNGFLAPSRKKSWTLDDACTDQLPRSSFGQLQQHSDQKEPLVLSTSSDLFCHSTQSNYEDSDCPNVSLWPLTEHRLARISSMDSDRKVSIDSSNDDCDAIPYLIANVLIVSHGGFLRELMRHFVDDLSCTLPGGKRQALRLSPNTGLSKFTVSVGDSNEKPKITCLLIHDKDHLTDSGVNSVCSSAL